MVRATFIVVLVTALSASARAGEDKVERGIQVYGAQKCSMCHSIAGKGNLKGSLDGVGSKLTPAEINQWIVDPVAMSEKTKAQRKPPMKVKPMSTADVESLVAYLSTLKKK